MGQSPIILRVARAYRSGVDAGVIPAIGSGGAGPAQPPAQRVGLCTVDHARTVHGLTYEQALERIETGEFRFAFDISVRRRIRSIRIWRGGGDVPVGQVVDSIIGTGRERLSAVEVGRILVCSRPHVHRLLNTGLLLGNQRRHVTWVFRESLAQFLKSRVV